MSEPSPAGSLHVPRTWRFASIVAAVMVLLALLGVGLTTSNMKAGPAYWMSLVPVYGLFCVWTAKMRTGRGSSAVVRQVFHWIGVAVAIALDFSIRGAGEESGTAAGMSAMLLLALGCYLAGVHLEWLFTVVGIVLTLALIVVSKAQEYVWYFVAVGVLAAVGLAILHRVAEPARPAGGNP